MIFFLDFIENFKNIYIKLLIIKIILYRKVYFQEKKIVIV